jgi:hypothetical protein
MAMEEEKEMQKMQKIKQDREAYKAVLDEQNR